MQNDIEDFMKAVKDIGYAVKLDTNGTFPDRLIHICESGLCDYVAVDLKNSWKNYPKTIGLSDEQAAAVVKNIQRSVEYLKQGSVDFELRTTIVKELHDKDDVFVDSGDVLGNENQKDAYTAHSIDTMKEFCKLAKQYAPLVMLRGVD